MPISGIGSVPGLPGPELARGLAGTAFRADRIAAARGDHLGAERLAGFGLRRGEPDRAGPRALGPRHHHRRHLRPGHDPAGGKHRDVEAALLQGADHLGDQHQGRNLAAVAAGLAALGNDDIDPGGGLAQGMLLGPDQRRHRHAVLFA
jgi:hypothetical protein